MTNTPDTSPEAVERLADALECAARVSSASKMICGWLDEAAQTLRALYAKLEAEKERSNKFMWQVRDTCKRAEAAEAELYQRKADSKRWRQEATSRTNELIAERDALKAELAEAVGVMQAWKTAGPDQDYYQAVQKRNAFLARHQKETDT